MPHPHHRILSGRYRGSWCRRLAYATRGVRVLPGAPGQRMFPQVSDRIWTELIVRAVVEALCGPITPGWGGTDARFRSVQTAYRRWAVTIVVAVAGLLSSAGLLAPPASAAIPLGGGSGISVNGTPCTLTTIGHDGTGELVGFTSAHCGGPGTPVAAEGAAGSVGSVVSTDVGLDYVVIKFDANKVTPVADIGGFPINGVGQNPPPGQTQLACQQSRATGHACADVVGSVVIDLRPPGTETSPEKAEKIRDGTSTFDAFECGHPGDDGAPVTVNNLLVGMMRGGLTSSEEPCPQPFVAPPHLHIPQHLRPVILSFNAILDAANATGGPGSGFVPVPA